MNNLYFKGLDTDHQEFDQVKRIFNQEGLNLTNVFYSYTSLPLTSNDKIMFDINDEVRRSNPIGQNVNVICNSIGCNFGVLAANKSPKIKNMILISPRFGQYSKEEKRKIKSQKLTQSNPKNSFDSEKIKTIILFNKTKSYTNLAIEKIKIPILIVYSKNDVYVPKEYLNDLASKKDNIIIKDIDSSSRNLLVPKEKTLRLIKPYLK